MGNRRCEFPFEVMSRVDGMSYDGRPRIRSRSFWVGTRQGTLRPGLVQDGAESNWDSGSDV